VSVAPIRKGRSEYQHDRIDRKKNASKHAGSQLEELIHGKKRRKTKVRLAATSASLFEGSWNLDECADAEIEHVSEARTAGLKRLARFFWRPTSLAVP
jgi:hypothetical protein